MRFKIQIESDDRTFEADPGETLLSAALRQGVGLPYGCRNGQCGSCAAQLLAGSIRYPSGQTEGLEGKPAGTCLTCQAVAESDLRLAVTRIRTAAMIEVRTLPCRVDRLERLNHDVTRLFLKLPEQQRLPFMAGQYLEFVLSDGRLRAFSIANAPHDDAFIELHVRQVPGGEFTDFVFDGLREKAILRIQGPLGSFVLREESARPMLLIGGGTGFAPLKGMIEHALHVGIQRSIRLYWGVRSRRDLYLAELPATWSQRHPDFRFTPVLSEPDPDWSGRTGFVHEAVLADHPDLDRFDVYLSGPPVMVEAGRAAFAARGLGMDQMFSDAFTYAADGKRP
ncbi:CDP-6-deoxy-delta-3,4-glucoseen reductase [Thiocystis violascens]|uniref:2-polyprenylphenol hydroxylase-like oxidoreductase n=1 Tax=Thiocystis violascens (strain ATCC 17096 / DSM 198 / 6111) TaxID=765911 RepID=I3YFE3_THIV6|nr:CDP-6-deoxy-delta-3,4-glucoseen reductase [Thiocystis violascens]AFL75711.1 2-polyprenylphenol hydroxylase-like oxidoreductase [Thiocystis violascens DSM 198]